MQPLIDQELAEAAALLKTKSEDTLTVDELVNLALIYMEIGDWDSVDKYTSRVLLDEATNVTLSNEHKAIALYALGTRKRELNFCEEALSDYTQAQQLAKSDWLKSNLLRNLGLVHLKQQRFQEAHNYFQDAYEFVLTSNDPELRGSLPALLNYSALALGRAALASDKNPAPSIALFDEASSLYDTIFTEKGINDDVARRRSNDYISHCVHRGMILCESSEKHPSENHNLNLLHAEGIFLEALKSRKENKADGQRLGDVCGWLGRVYERLQKIEASKQAYNEALSHYRTIFSSEDAKQISDVKSRLAHLTFGNVVVSTLTQHGTFRPEISESSKMILSFARTHYPSLVLQPDMLQQLLWLQGNSVITSQSNVHSQKDLVNIEVKRILSRLYSFHLLMEGGAPAYSAFVQSQAADVRLSEANFNRLSQFVQALAPASRECLMATCFITKSDQAITAVPSDRRHELPADSEQFITHMVTHFANVFPICASLSTEAMALLPYAFYKNSHARQMLDMEGGYNMLANLTQAVSTSTMTSAQYNLWFARWIINIAGLDGHVNPRGSVYLTEPVADCIWALKSELDQLWENPYHPVIDNYLLFRQQQLKVTGTYIAYLGALMRQYSPEKGQEIQAWFNALSEHEQQEKMHVFKTQLEQTKITPTFKPTVLVNLLHLGATVPDALTIFTEIESHAAQVYMSAIADGHILQNKPLSYRNVAFEEFLSPIKAYYDRNHRLPTFNIDSDGYLNVTTDALQEENTITSIV